MPLAVGDLVNTHMGKVSDLMIGPLAGDDAVYQIRDRRLRNVKKSRCRFLSHLLSKTKKCILEAIADPGKVVCPGNLLLYSSVSGAKDLLRSIKQKYFNTVNWNISPLPLYLRLTNDFASKPALGTSTSVLVRLDHYSKSPVTIAKLKINNFENLLEPEKLADKLGCVHKWCLLSLGCLISTYRENAICAFVAPLSG